MEQMRGVKPPSQPWQGRILIVEPHLQYLYVALTRLVPKSFIFASDIFIILENYLKINSFLLYITPFFLSFLTLNIAKGNKHTDAIKNLRKLKVKLEI